LGKALCTSRYCFVKATSHPSCTTMQMNNKGTDSYTEIATASMWFGKELSVNSILSFLWKQTHPDPWTKPLTKSANSDKFARHCGQAWISLSWTLELGMVGAAG
jgi:hypothetical protein